MNQEISGTALRDDAREWIEQVKSVDVIVGIPSFKNAATIGHVVKVAGKGLAKYFAGLRTAIVNSDGGSPDGTREVVRGTRVPPGVQVLATEYQGPPGKGSAFRAIFEIAAALQAKACIVVDSDLRSITPEWIDRLGGPVLRDGFAFIAPLYTRHKHDGTITNNITYPMTRMLYGLDVRQPIGGDFGFAGRVARWWLEQNVWDTDVARYGIDIWMTTTAIAQGYKVGQAGLGLKIHDAKDPAAALGPMFNQVVGTLFALMKRYADQWQTVRSVQAAPLVGELPLGEPEPVPVTVPALIAKLREGLGNNADILGRVLAPQQLDALERISAASEESFTFPSETWARIVFDFAAAYNDAVLPASQIMAAMVPLYYGRTAGLVLQAREMSAGEFEQQVVQVQAETFLSLKPELVARWRS
jgi:glycosyltransferase involved in cell wall biosynthesis